MFRVFQTIVKRTRQEMLPIENIEDVTQVQYQRTLVKRTRVKKHFKTREAF